MKIEFLIDDKTIKKYLPIIAYKKYITDGLWCCGYNNDDELCFILSFVVKKKLIFKYLAAVSETIIVKKGFNEVEFLNVLIKELYLKDEYDFISQPNTTCLFQNYPDGAIFAPFGSYGLDLKLDNSILWGNVHSKHKNVIKRAVRNNVIVKFGEDMFSDSYEIIFNTLKRNNMSMISKNKLLKLHKTNSNNFLVGCSYLDDKPQSAVIILFDKYKGYYLWGGTNNNVSLGSNNLLHWEVIKKLKSFGVKYYDFVGARINTKNTRLLGIQRFKNRFGATLKQGYLWKYPIVKWKYILFSLLYKLKMKKGDIIEQEKVNINL